jgi:hypothetical protein
MNFMSQAFTSSWNVFLKVLRPPLAQYEYLRTDGLTNAEIISSGDIISLI